jgi:hypothetical protein
MFPIQAYLVTAHLDDLRREAAASRLARQAALAEGDTFGGGSMGPRRPDLRRALARAAIRLSVLADGAARRLDPCLEDAFGIRRATSAAGR